MSKVRWLGGSIAEKKQLLRIWVPEMKLAPEQREVLLTYRVPEPVMNKMVAGARYERIHDVLAPLLSRSWTLPGRGPRRGLPVGRVGAAVPDGGENSPGRDSNPTHNEDGPQERFLGAAAVKAS